jgi:hypothetical protein
MHLDAAFHFATSVDSKWSIPSHHDTKHHRSAGSERHPPANLARSPDNGLAENADDRWTSVFRARRCADGLEKSYGP